MKTVLVRKFSRRCFPPGSKALVRFFIFLGLALSTGCAGPGYFAGEDVILNHFTKKEITKAPYKIVQDKKSFYIVCDNPDENTAGKPKVSQYHLYKGTFIGGASDNQANMIARLVAESHNLSNADLKNTANEISASIRDLSSSTDNKFLALNSRISALENRLKELASSLSASANLTRKATETVSHDTQQAMAEILSLKNEMDRMPSEIIVAFPKGKHVLPAFEEERFVRFLDSVVHLARRRRLYFAILSRNSSVSQKRTSSLVSTIDRYLSGFPYEINTFTGHGQQRDKEAILVRVSLDPDQFPKSKELSAADEIKPIPKVETPSQAGRKAPNTTGNTLEFSPSNPPSIPMKEKQDKAGTDHRRSEKTLNPVPVIPAPPTIERIPDKPSVIDSDKGPREQIKEQSIEIRKDKNDDRGDPNIEELRQILMDSGRRRK